MSTAFKPGQRFLSEAEPELGLGLVSHVEMRQIELAFPLLEETRRYVIDNAPLLRLQLNPGDTAHAVHGWDMHVSSVSQRDQLFVYTGTRNDTGETVELPEPLLSAQCSLNQPRERLLAGQAGHNRDFELRVDSLQRLATAHRSPHFGLHGPRVSLLPHQLYVADQVSRRHNPRVLLADEVGLGKTIEAGMIIHRQLLTGRASRVLIVVPDALKHQWLIELRRRFNLRFTLVTEESVEPFSEAQCLLCPLSLLLEDEALGDAALMTDWDMLVVDEAHHLSWSRDEASPAYELVDALARETRSVLLLTATPEQLGREGHFARLRLLDPDRFHDLDAHLASETSHLAVAAAAEPLWQSEATLSADERTTLEHYLDDDASRAVLAKPLDDSARRELLNRLIDHHGTGRVLFRNTRAAVGGLPRRSLQHHPLPSDSAATPADARLAWLLNTLKTEPEKRFLLICAEDDTALDIATDLRLKAGIVAAVFHGGMSILECDRAAAHFADADSGCPILISSEVGSEGRNFQFVNELILFDLPREPDLLEQRIGRVDRIGQNKDVIVHVPTREGDPDHILCRWYDEGLGAFSQSCNYGNAVLQQVGADRDAALDNPGDADTVNTLISDTQRVTEAVRATLDAGRDRLLELASTDPVESAALALELQQMDDQPGPWPFIERAADSFGLDLEELSGDSYSIHIGSNAEQQDFPGLPEDGCSGTDDRAVALHREDLEFITWEHPLVRGLLHMVIDGDTGKTAAAALQAQPFKPGEVLIESIFSVQSAVPGNQWQRYLPTTWLRLLHTRSGLEIAGKVPSNWLAMNVKNVDRGTARKLIEAQRDSLSARLLSIEDDAKSQFKPIADAAREEAGRLLGAEIDRLQSLITRGAPVREDELAAITQERDNIDTSLANLTPQLEAIRVIFTH